MSGISPIPTEWMSFSSIQINQSNWRSRLESPQVLGFRNSLRALLLSVTAVLGMRDSLWSSHCVLSAALTEPSMGVADCPRHSIHLDWQLIRRPKLGGWSRTSEDYSAFRRKRLGSWWRIWLRPQEAKLNSSRTRMKCYTRLKCSVYGYGANQFQPNSRETSRLLGQTKHSYSFREQRDVHPMVELIGYSRRCVRCAF